VGTASAPLAKGSQALTIPVAAQVGANGSATFTFPAVPEGFTWTGTLLCPGAPVTALFSAMVGATPWGSWAGNSVAGPVQCTGNQQLVVTATGLTPNAAALLEWLGSSDPSTLVAAVWPDVNTSAVAEQLVSTQDITELLSTNSPPWTGIALGSDVITFTANANFVVYIFGITANFTGTIDLIFEDLTNGLNTGTVPLNVVAGVYQQHLYLIPTQTGDNMEIALFATVGTGTASVVLVGTTAQVVSDVAVIGTVAVIGGSSESVSVYNVGGGNEAPVHVSFSDSGAGHLILGAPAAGLRNRLHRFVGDPGTGTGPIYLIGGSTAYVYSRCMPTNANDNMDGLFVNESLYVYNYGGASPWTGTLFWDLILSPGIT
jgi:hypothetical protein